MSLIGNILWFFLSGFWQGLGWLLAGLLWCITIIGIPMGVQCFKIAGMAFFPFGKEVVSGGGVGSILLNILWLVFGGLPIALGTFFNGILLCMTIIGIPFGIQCFKLATLALVPFGSRIVRK